MHEGKRITVVVVVLLVGVGREPDGLRSSSGMVMVCFFWNSRFFFCGGLFCIIMLFRFGEWRCVVIWRTLCMRALRKLLIKILY